MLFVINSRVTNTKKPPPVARR